MNMLKEKKNVVIAIVIALLVIIAIIAGIALTQKPTVSNNDNTETENVIDTEDDTMTMVEDSTQNDTTESEDVSDTEDSETEEEETDSQTSSSEEDEKDDTDDKSDETDDKKDDESDDKKDEETDDTDDGKEDVDDSEEQEEPADSEEETEELVDDDDEDTLSPKAKKLVAAGYGVVVNFGDGSYGVLTHNDGCVNGIDGFDILYNYLQSLDLEWSSASGGYIDADKDWYMFVASGVHEIDHSDDDWTDDGEIEFID